MISMPIALVVTQWVLLLALALLVLLMYRQLAHLLHLSGSAHDAGGPVEGEPAQAFRYHQPGEPLVHDYQPGEQATLLLFSDPRCGACDAALEAVETVTRNSRAAGLRVLVITDADDIAVAANNALANTALDVAVVDRGVTHDYRIAGTPLLVGVDREGVVRAKASSPDQTAVRRLLKDIRRATSGAAEVPETKKEVNLE